MGNYEFTEQENVVMDELAGNLRVVGILQIVFGIVILVLAFITLRFVPETNLVARTIDAAAMIALGVAVYRPADNFKRIVTTRGRDIDELMTGIEELDSGFTVIVTLAGVDALVILVEMLTFIPAITG